MWQFVSGGGEEGETPAQAARRESFEEAGIAPSSRFMPLDSTTTIPACWYEAWAEWPASLLVIPEYAFAVEADACRIVLSDEHQEFRWVPYGDALELVRFDSNRGALWELKERLFPGPRCRRPAYC